MRVENGLLVHEFGPLWFGAQGFLIVLIVLSLLFLVRVFRKTPPHQAQRLKYALAAWCWPEAALWLVAGALISVLYQPLLDWLQAGIDRVILGQRAEQREMLEEFTEIMPTILEAA
jgi:hypothetical protein